MDAKKLGKKIKLVRIWNDMSQTELAEKVGLRQKSISRYETGLSAPSISTLIKLMKTLNKSADYFLNERQKASAELAQSRTENRDGQNFQG